MWRLMIGMVAAGFLLLTIGCSGGSNGASQPAADSTVTSDSVATSTPSTAAIKPPEAYVTRFLEAVRTGDDATAESLLTPLAKKKTAELDIVVAPPGSETATFEIGKTELVDGGIAHVASTWTDLDNSKHPHTDEIIWCLRRQGQDWRIAGMATKVFEDQPPLLLNFEDPEDMIRKQKLVEQEIRRRMGALHQKDSNSPSLPPATAKKSAGSENVIQR